MKKSAIVALFVLSFVLGAAIFGACSGPWNSGKGIVRINLGGGARSVAVTDEMKAAMVYDISLTKGTEVVEQKLERGDVTASFTVAPGVWNIAIHAYLNADDRENEKPFATGQGSVPVTAGKTSTAKITMKPEEKEIYWTVKLDLDGGSCEGSEDGIYTFTILDGSKIVLDITFTKEGHESVVWYKDEGRTVPWDFATDTVTGDITLYAMWKPVTTEPPDGGIDVEIDWGNVTEEEKS